MGALRCRHDLDPPPAPRAVQRRDRHWDRKEPGRATGPDPSRDPRGADSGEVSVPKTGSHSRAARCPPGRSELRRMKRIPGRWSRRWPRTGERVGRVSPEGPLSVRPGRRRESDSRGLTGAVDSAETIAPPADW